MNVEKLKVWLQSNVRLPSQKLGLDVWQANGGVARAKVLGCEPMTKFIYTDALGPQMQWMIKDDPHKVLRRVSPQIDRDVLENRNYDVTMSAMVDASPDPVYFWSVVDTANRSRFTRLYRQLGTYQAEPIKLEDWGIPSTGVVSVTGTSRGVMLATDGGLLYHVDAQGTLMLQGLAPVWFTQHAQWVDALSALVLHALDKRRPRDWERGQSKAVEVAPILSLTGLTDAHAQAPLPAWYDSLSNSVILHPDDTDPTTLVCLGQASDGWGAWLWNQRTQKIAYQEHVPMEGLQKCFAGNVLIAESVVPKAIWLVLEESPTDRPVIGAIQGQDGAVQISTHAGLLLEVNRQGRALTLRLLGTQASFALNQDHKTLEEALGKLCKRYAHGSAMPVQLTATTSTWFVPKAGILVKVPDEYKNRTVNYLGYNHREGVVYLSLDGQDLLSVQKTNKTIFVKGGASVYQRAGDLLLMSLSRTESSPYVVNVDASKLLIVTAGSTAEATHQIDLSSFDYPLVEVGHYSPGLLLITDILDAECRVVREGAHLKIMSKKRVHVLQEVFPAAPSSREKMLVLFAKDVNQGAIALTTVLAAYLKLAEGCREFPVVTMRALLKSP